MVGGYQTIDLKNIAFDAFEEDDGEDLHKVPGSYEKVKTDKAVLIGNYSLIEKLYMQPVEQKARFVIFEKKDNSTSYRGYAGKFNVSMNPDEPVLMKDIMIEISSYDNVHFVIV